MMLRSSSSILILLAAAAGSAANAQTDEGAAAILYRLAEDRSVRRDISLADLGITGPSILGAMDGRKEVYLPVPAGVQIRDASLKIAGKYLRAEGGRTTFLVSIDGYPVAARSPDQGQGPIDVELGVDGGSRPSGFVRLNMAWSSVVGDNLCVDERSIGNVAEIAPTTRFSYSYDRASIKDLATAWSALPHAPTVLVARKKLSKESFDAAWRIGLSLERAGKRPVIMAMPAVGDTISREKLKIPASLQQVPAFRNLSGAEAYTLRDLAEVGAVLLARSGEFDADVTIADSDLVSDIKAALDALAAQISPMGGEVSAAYAKWRAEAFSLVESADSEVKLSTIGNRQTIAVAPSAAGKAAELFQSLWKALPTGTAALGLRTVDLQSPESTSIPLLQASGGSGALDVLARADWAGAFEIGRFGPDGMLPSSIDVDVSAAPGVSDKGPVVSVFLNDYLLSARRLKENGEPERLSAAIPLYALAPRNVIRVTFQRQPSSDRCRETPQSFPAAILPSSRIHFDKVKPGNDFLGLVPAMATGAAVIIPSHFLNDSLSSISIVSRLAGAAGISPGRAETVVSDSEIVPAGPFLAIEVPLKGVLPKLAVQGDRLVVKATGGETILDVQGLQHIGTAEIVTSGSHSGILYRSLGSAPLLFSTSFQFSRGDAAILGTAGIVSEFMKSDPAAAPASEPEQTALTWESVRRDPWKLGAFASAAAAFFFLLMFARAAAVRRRKT